MLRNNRVFNWVKYIVRSRGTQLCAPTRVIHAGENYYNRVFKQILLFALIGLTGIIFWSIFASEIALSQQSDSRLNSLEFDFRNLESRLDRLENQIYRTPQSNLPRTPASGNRRRDRTPLTQAQSFDNLATLVIELKQQVNQLEVRVKKLEAQKR